MAVWRDIAKDNFDAGKLLIESKLYRLSRYVALLSEVEEAIEDETNSHVLLVPTLVD